jgi:hypothetical protein
MPAGKTVRVLSPEISGALTQPGRKLPAGPVIRFGTNCYPKFRLRELLGKRLNYNQEQVVFTVGGGQFRR